MVKTTVVNIYQIYQYLFLVIEKQLTDEIYKYFFFNIDSTSSPLIGYELLSYP